MFALYDRRKLKSSRARWSQDRQITRYSQGTRKNVRSPRRNRVFDWRRRASTRQRAANVVSENSLCTLLHFHIALPHHLREDSFACFLTWLASRLPLLRSLKLAKYLPSALRARLEKVQDELRRGVDGGVYFLPLPLRTFTLRAVVRSMSVSQ